jgi:Toprim-like
VSASSRVPDLLTLRQWGVPSLALCGTGITPTILQLLDQWNRLYAVLDADAAGRDATALLIDAFGSRVIPVQLPPGTKDPADLAPLPDGSNVFCHAVRLAVERSVRPAPTLIFQPAIAAGPPHCILLSRSVEPADLGRSRGRLR